MSRNYEGIMLFNYLKFKKYVSLEYRSFDMFESLKTP